MQHAERHTIARAEFVDIGAAARGYYAVPIGAGPFPGVLVFQEAFGVNEYVQSEVRRLAEHGYAAIAPDLFDGETFAYSDSERVFARMTSLTDDGMLEKVNAAAAHVDADARVKPGKLGAIGFCMGGRLAFLTAATLGERIAAAASFYGGGIAGPHRVFKQLLDRVPDVKAELLLVYGAEDTGITPSEHGRLAEALSTHKKAYTLSVYPGAGHGFASRDRVQSYHAPSAERAWELALLLFARTL